MPEFWISLEEQPDGEVFIGLFSTRAYALEDLKESAREHCLSLDNLDEGDYYCCLEEDGYTLSVFPQTLIR